MSTARRVGAVIRREGEDLTLRLRGAVGDSPEFFAAFDVKAKREGSRAENLAGDAQQRSITFRISNLEIAAQSPAVRAPRKLDELTDSDGQVFVIQKVDTRKRGATPVLHIVEAMGDA